MGHYDDIRDEYDDIHRQKRNREKQRMLEQALLDVRKLSCYHPDKIWSITDIRCVDLFTAIEDRIKSDLYSLGAHG